MVLEEGWPTGVGGGRNERIELSVIRALLEDPAVAVGVVEERVRVPTPRLARDSLVDRPALFLDDLQDLADFHPVLDELGPRRVDVGDDDLELWLWRNARSTFQTRLRYGTQAGAVTTQPPGCDDIRGLDDSKRRGPDCATTEPAVRSRKRVPLRWDGGRSLRSTEPQESVEDGSRRAGR